MESLVSLRHVFTKTFEENFYRVLKHAITMSRHPTPEDLLSEISKPEVLCLISITSLGTLDVTMSNTISKLVEEWKLFPRVTTSFGGKIREEYNIPTAFLLNALNFAIYGNKLGFLKIPSALINFIKVLINEAKEGDEASKTNLPSLLNDAKPKAEGNIAGPSSPKSCKAASRPCSGPSTSSTSSARGPTLSAIPDPTPVPTKSALAASRPCSGPSTSPSTSSARGPTPSAIPDPTPVPTKSAFATSRPSAGPSSFRGRPCNPKKSEFTVVEIPVDSYRATKELWKAVVRVDDEAALAAIEAGADLSTRNWTGDTPLHEACVNGREAVVRSLISHGVELEVKGVIGWAPLHWAAGSGSLGCVSALLDAGASIHVKDKNLSTPLHYAACLGHLPCIKLLLERGADLNARDNDGDTPLSLAVLGKHPTIKQFLESVGGTR